MQLTLADGLKRVVCVQLNKHFFTSQLQKKYHKVLKKQDKAVDKKNKLGPVPQTMKRPQEIRVI
jgi:hypothetical protein